MLNVYSATPPVPQYKAISLYSYMHVHLATHVHCVKMFRAKISSANNYLFYFTPLNTKLNQN